MIFKKIFYFLLKYFFILKPFFGIYAAYIKTYEIDSYMFVINYPWFVIITDILFLALYLLLLYKVGYYSSSIKIEEFMFENRGGLRNPLTLALIYLFIMFFFYLGGDNIEISYIVGSIIIMIIWFNWTHMRKQFRKIYKEVMES